MIFHLLSCFSSSIFSLQYFLSYILFFFTVLATLFSPSHIDPLDNETLSFTISTIGSSSTHERRLQVNNDERRPQWELLFSCSSSHILLKKRMILGVVQQPPNPTPAAGG
jgi:hypothetical protein